MLRLNKLSALIVLVFLVCIGTGCDEMRLVNPVVHDLMHEQGEERAPNSEIRVREISYYADEELTRPLGTAVAGETLYTKVVFSEAALIAVGHAPYIAYRTGPFDVRVAYRIVSSSGPLQDGEARPHKKDLGVFVCKQTHLDPFSYIATEVVIPVSLNNNFTSSEILSAYPHGSDDLTVSYSFHAEDNSVFVDFVGSHEAVNIHHTYGGAGYMLVYADILRRRPFHIYVHDQDKGDISVVGFPVGDQDFHGLVLSPLVPKEKRAWLRAESRPVEGALLTVLSGPKKGETAITNVNGWYLFPNVEGDELHLLVEKDHFEPKEVVVHRALPTALPGSSSNDKWHSVSSYESGVQWRSGVILIGQRWPDEVRFIFEQMEVVPDLLWMEGGTDIIDGRSLGFYHTDGVIICYSRPHNTQDNFFHTLSHEIFHAHQDYVVSPDGLGRTQDWIHTNEGQAFVAAKKRDWEEVGKAEYDLVDYYADSDLENSAHTAALYFGIDRWEVTYRPHEDLKTVAPHRYRWCQEWLNK